MFVELIMHSCNIMVCKNYLLLHYLYKRNTRCVIIIGTIIATWRILILNEEDCANAAPSIRNYVPELPTFGEIAGDSPTKVQWKGLTLGEPHSG